jgi:glycosyltransferase involved in cell wall biosynthesis
VGLGGDRLDPPGSGLAQAWPPCAPGDGMSPLAAARARAEAGRASIAGGPAGPRPAEALRILTVSSVFPNAVHPEWGIFNGHSIRHLAAVARVRVVSPVKWFPGLRVASRRERALARIPPAADYCGLDVSHPRYFRTPGFGLSWHAWFYRRSLQRHIERLVAEHRPDVLLAVCAWPDGVAVQQIGEDLGIPVVIKCNGSDIHQLLGDRLRGPRILDALHRAARIVTVSGDLSRLIALHGVSGDKVDVVYNGVDRQLFRPIARPAARAALGIPHEDTVLLCVANLVPIKGHHDLLRAFQLLRDRLAVDARLVLVGDGPLRRALEDDVHALRLGAHVTFAGARPQREVPSWIGASDAVCLASGNEGLPNVLVEALSCGRPVVATRVGGVPELVRSDAYGRLVRPGDAMAMARAMQEVLRRPWDPQLLCACPQLTTWEQSTTQLLAALSRARSAL